MSVAEIEFWKCVVEWFGGIVTVVVFLMIAYRIYRSM